MTNEEIEILKELLLTNIIVWMAGDCYYKVRTIGNMYDEPSECAVFVDGGYVALYNIDIKEFFILKEIIILKRDKIIKEENND